MNLFSEIYTYLFKSFSPLLIHFFQKITLCLNNMSLDDHHFFFFFSRKHIWLLSVLDYTYTLRIWTANSYQFNIGYS